MLSDRLLPITDNRMLKRLNKTIDTIFTNDLSYVIWGAGYTGRTVADYISRYDSLGKTKPPEYSVDNNKSLWGTGAVKSPAEFECDMNKIDLVLVCVYVADQVVDQLRAIGYSGEIMVVSASVFNIDEKAIRYYDEHLQDIEVTYSEVSDEKSKKTIEIYLNVIRTGDIELWDEVKTDSLDKLLDPEVVNFSKKEHYVDIGAFTGDTLSRFLLHTGGKYESIVCIEPDVGNYSQVKALVEDEGLDNATIINAGAGASAGTMRFKGNSSESCILSEDGDCEVDIVALDDIEEALDTTLLKVSTNGFDLNALKGAEHIIKRNKPQIATYVSGEQLWTVPRYLLSIVPEYKLYIRHYGVGRQAMILYAKV